MQKLPLHEKIIKHAKIKIIQQEVQNLHEKEKSREAKVEEFQSEEENLTDHIQSMQ